MSVTVPCEGRQVVRPQGPELGTHLTEEDIAKIAAAYNPDDPRMMKKLAGEPRAEKEIATKQHLLEGFRKALWLSPAVADAAGQVYDQVLAKVVASERRIPRLDIAAYAVLQAARQYNLPVRTRQILAAAKEASPGRRSPTLHSIFVIQQEFPVAVVARTASDCQVSTLKKLVSEGLLTPVEYYDALQRARDYLAGIPASMKTGHNPWVQAAASIYASLPPAHLSGRPKITKEEAARAAGVAECSVREYLKDIRHEQGCRCISPLYAKETTK